MSMVERAMADRNTSTHNVHYRQSAEVWIPAERACEYCDALIVNLRCVVGNDVRAIALAILLVEADRADPVEVAAVGVIAGDLPFLDGVLLILRARLADACRAVLDRGQAVSCARRVGMVHVGSPCGCFAGGPAPEFASVGDAP